MNEGARRYQPSAMRASDADRDAVLGQLSEHFQAGRLNSEEFDERSSLALRARTFGDLAELTKDLPPAGQVVVRRAESEAGRTGPRLPTAAIGASLALFVLVLAVVTVGGIDRGGSHLWWLVFAGPLILWRVARSRR